jgi:CheY-like chemotaxis protein
LPFNLIIASELYFMQNFKSILIVDDDYASNYLTEMILQDLQITDHIFVARNGKEALDLIKDYCQDEHPATLPPCPQLIFLDINMPVMDGFEFLEEFEKLDHIKKNPIPILLLTTSTNGRDIEKAKRYQVSAYIEKPLTEDKIVKIVETILS